LKEFGFKLTPELAKEKWAAQQHRPAKTG
jgi:hypothetical protein